MNITEIFISFNIQHFQKISNLGNLNFVIKIDASHDETTCPVFTLKNYIERTKEKRKSFKLLGFLKTFQQVTLSSIARWLKLLLELSGKDISIFFLRSIMFDGLTIGSHIKRHLQPLPFTGFITEIFRSDLAFASCSIPEKFLNYLG